MVEPEVLDASEPLNFTQKRVGKYSKAGKKNYKENFRLKQTRERNRIISEKQYNLSTGSGKED